MPGFENLLRTFVYSTPTTKWCWINGPFGSKTKYPCGVEYIEHKIGIYAGITYPSVTPEQQAKIYNCAYSAGAVVVGELVAACTAGAVAGVVVGCVPAVLATLPLANESGRIEFYRCLDNSDLPHDIKSQCTFGIYKKDL